MDLYLIRMGGFLSNTEWIWMFIVEEFRKPGSENASIFPWNDFEARSLAQLVALNLKADGADQGDAPSNNKYVFRGNVIPSKVRLTYKGTSREIGAERLKFIELWVGAYGSDPEYAKSYEREFLFQENKTEYWIPLAKMIIPHFEKVIKQGAELDLYLIRLGGINVDQKTDWVFLVEEFQSAERVK